MVAIRRSTSQSGGIAGLSHMRDWKGKAPLPDGEQERVAAKCGESSAYPSLHDVQQFNQEIIDCAAEGIIVCDRELRYQVWNHFMEQLTGRRAPFSLDS